MMKKNSIVSVIITTFNRKNLISQSLNSVLRQTYKDLEIIIVDDASDDGTEEFVEKEFNDPRIKYFRMAENRGATAARNFGLEKMSGDYFLVWDSDDVLYPNAIETIIGIFNKSSNDLAAVSAPARCLLNNKEVEFKKMPEGMILKELVISRSLATNHKVRIARSSLCGDVRYQARNIDFLVNVQMVERGNWYCIGQYLADVILESDINSLTIHRKKTDLNLSVLRAPFLGGYLRKYRTLLKNGYPTKYAGFAYGAALGFYAAGNKKESRYFIVEAIKNGKRLKYFLALILFFIPFGSHLLKWVVIIKNNYFSTSSSKTKNLARKKI
jgi:glycosyltransferase involved in cell wall biosynthesis